MKSRIWTSQPTAGAHHWRCEDVRPVLPYRPGPIFAERWTPLIIRNLYLGYGNFSEILEGAPGLSRTLLSGAGITTSSRLRATTSSTSACRSASGGHAIRRCFLLHVLPRLSPHSGITESSAPATLDLRTSQLNLQSAHGQYVASTFGFAGLVRPLGLRSQAQTWSA